MEKGYSQLTKILIQCLDNEKKEEINIFIQDAKNQDYLELHSNEEVNNLFGNVSSEFTKNLTYNESLNLRAYTGFSHKQINALFRDNWTYEKHGILTNKLKHEYLETGEDLEKIIFKFPSLERNIKVYRGVTLEQFRTYGIYTLADLVNMKDKLFYDSGFTSTSLIRKDSLYNTKAFQLGNRNIEIEYLIPESCRDGALLLNEFTSSYKTENEYIINCGSLIKIISVDIDKEKNTAYLKALLIPKKIWDPNAIRNLEENRQIIKR